MIPKLIKLGIETTLKVICEEIVIKNIKIVNKNDIFNGIIDELSIKAESIIFNKINISYINIKIRDLVLNLSFNNKKFFINNYYAVINMRLSKDNINKTLFDKRWKSLKTLIEAFISTSFQSIEIKNKSIYFISSDVLSDKNINYILQYDKNSISLINNNNQEKLLILNDKNITINNLLFYESYIELELHSKIIFN